MSFLDSDYHSLRQDQKLYTDNYESHHSSCTRYSTFFHCLNHLFQIKKNINNNRAQNKATLSDDQLINIKYDESSEFLAKSISESYMKIQSDESKLTSGDTFKLVIGTFKISIIKIILLYWVDAILRLSISILVLYLFYAVEDGNSTLGFAYTAVVCAIWYFLQVVKQNALLMSYVLASKIKGALSMLLYGKISSFSSYCIKSSQLGKITNLLASDLGLIEWRLATFFTAFSFPIVVLGSCVLLIVRLGWPGVLGIAFVLLTIPVTNCISKRNGSLYEQISRYKDKRVQTTSDVIQGIRFIKLYGWEIPFRKIIQQLRVQQILNYKSFGLGRSFERAFGNFAGIASGYIIYVLAHYGQTGLDLAKIFSSLEVLFTLKYNIYLLVMAIGFYYELVVVFERFASIFSTKNTSMVQIDPISKEPIVQRKASVSADNLKSNNILAQSTDNINELTKEQQPNLMTGEILFRGFNGYWKDSFEVPSLGNIDLFFRPGVFYGITGRVGSGKSGLLGAMLREVPFYSGHFGLRGSVSYVEQEPVIFSDSLRNNILFGRDFSKALYTRTVQEACLTSDLEMLEDGDQTIVGERGVTLSGGQKARLALARALYADSDIFLLDDPISAVDSKVAREIHEKCLKRLSKTKTLILVTHQISFLYDCDQVIIMEEGKVKLSGHPSEMTKQLRNMSAILRGVDQQEVQKMQKEELLPLKPGNALKYVQEGNRQSKSVLSVYQQEKLQLYFKDYKKYFTGAPSNCILFPIMITLFIASQVVLSLFLRLLTNYELVKNDEPNIFGSSFAMYWGILGLLILLYFVFLNLKYYALYLTILNANQDLHYKMLNGIVRSPVSFFDATPSGVLISKFSNDIGILDNSLVHSLIDSFEGPASVIVVIVNICQVYPYFIPPATVMMIVIVLFFNYSREVIVQSRQADLKNKNPIYQFYGETVNGLVQIRASNRRASFITTFSQIINKSTKASISLEIASRGFSVYSAALSLAMMFTGMIIGVSQCNTISSGLFAMSVIFLFQCSDLLNWFLRQIAASESLMISYLRSSQIANLQPEKQLRTQYDSEVGLAEEVTAAREDRDVHTAWPEEPSMQFTNLSARYKPSLPLALDDLSFTIERNFKVGIVGRTGAGKSSLIQAIFRVIEPELGSKYAIGGHDALEMGLHSLRQHVSVIPQTPFLFKGTVQQNVDPFSTVSEELVWNALREAGLHDHVQSVLFRLLSCPRSCSPTSPTLRSPSQSARSSCSAWRGRSCGGTSSWCWTRPPRTWTWRPTTSSRRLSGSGSGTRRSSRSRTGSTPSPTTTRSSSCRRDASPKWARPTSSSSGRASSQKWSATPAKTPLSSPARPRPATRKSSINHDN